MDRSLNWSQLSFRLYKFQKDKLKDILFFIFIKDKNQSVYTENVHADFSRHYLSNNRSFSV